MMNGSRGFIFIIHHSSFRIRHFLSCPSLLIFTPTIGPLQKSSRRLLRELAALVDFLAVKVVGLYHASQLSSVIRRELVSVLVRLRRDARRRVGVEDDEVCVAARSDCALASVESGEPRGFEGEPAREVFERVPASPRLSPNDGQPELQRRDAAPGP